MILNSLSPSPSPIADSKAVDCLPSFPRCVLAPLMQKSFQKVNNMDDCGDGVVRFLTAVKVFPYNRSVDFQEAISGNCGSSGQLSSASSSAIANTTERPNCA